MIPPRDFEVLLSVAEYDTLTRAQITRLHFPQDDDGRITRKRLRILLDLGLLNQTNMRVVNPAVNGGVTAPVYYPSAKGAAFLAQERDDDRFLSVNATTPNWIYLYHFVAVAETHILLNSASALRPDLTVMQWFGERSLRDPKATEAHLRYRLYTLITQEPYLVCKPDAGFLLEKGGFRKVFYLEQDRDTTKSASRVAAQKCGGYAGLLERGLHREHFPEANVEKFTVLMVAPTVSRRDALRKAISSRGESGLWRFASLTDLSPESFFAAPVWFPAEGDPRPLVTGGAP